MFNFHDYFIKLVLPDVSINEDCAPLIMARDAMYSVAYAVVRCVSVRRHLRVLYRNDGKHILTFFHRLRDPPFQFLRTIRYGSIFQPGTPIVYLV